MKTQFYAFLIFVFLHNKHCARCTELTFELHERKKDCFYESFNSGEQAQIDFRVLSGGNADINVRLFDPDGEPAFSADKESRGGLVFLVGKSGIYKACFSNEFSALTKKLVFFVLRSGREDQQETMDLPDLPVSSSLSDSEIENRQAILDSLQSIGAALVSVSNYQRRIRLNEAADRMAAEETLNRVGVWSLVEIIGIVAASIAQVVAVRRFFEPASGGAGAAKSLGRRA